MLQFGRNNTDWNCKMNKITNLPEGNCVFNEGNYLSLCRRSNSNRNLNEGDSQEPKWWYMWSLKLSKSVIFWRSDKWNFNKQIYYKNGVFSIDFSGLWVGSDRALNLAVSVITHIIRLVPTRYNNTGARSNHQTTNMRVVSNHTHRMNSNVSWY